MLYLIDSAAILNDELFFFDEKNRYATTAPIVAEIRDFRSRSLVDNALKNRLLEIMPPKKEFEKKILREKEKLGLRLSTADVSLLALALELKEKREKVIVLTDDFTVQNLLLKLGVEFDGVIRGKIKKFI